MGSNADNLYITYVDVDRDLLKIWGQRNRIGATYIERQLVQLLPEFNRTPSPNPIQIRKGMFCFAKYTDDNYYRARVISGVQNDSVWVLFVDYGNKNLIKLSNIRIPEGSDKDVLAKMSEQAEEYYLAGIAAPPTGWTKEIVSEIRRDICYEEFFYQIVAQVGDQKILEIQFRNEDYSSYLVKNQLASPLSLPVQREMVLAYCSLVSSEIQNKAPFKESQKVAFAPSVPPPNIRSTKPLNISKDGMIPPNYGKSNYPVNFPIPSSVIRYSTPQHMSTPLQHVIPNISENPYYPPVNHLTNQVAVTGSSSLSVNPVLNPLLNNPYNSLHLCKDNSNSVGNNENIIQILAQQVKQYIAQDNAKIDCNEENTPHHYVNSVLEVGSNYNVIVSHIDDGPWSFSVQLLSSETELGNLMDELLSTELVPLKPPIILGHPCIASSALYGNLCRGVIVSISRNAVKVYFVDFGNTEDLPSSSIYELPPKFFKIRALSQKFCLNGLQKVIYSDDIKKFFKEVVQDELVMLRVTSLEDNNLPTCELYLKEKNIKRILNEKIREMRSSVEDFPKVGDTESVAVTWVVSPQKFFVQLHKRDAELNALKKELSEVEAKGQRLTYQQLSVGFKCVCKYENDGQWYRVVITSVDSENEIAVFYVDYGNTEKVNISLLRSIQTSGLIHQMGNQAIQCSLKGFENKTFDMELANKLESLILEKDLQMTIVSLEKELLSVQLFENGKDISELLAAFACDSKLKNIETSLDEKGLSSVSPKSSFLVQKEQRHSSNVEPYEKNSGKSRNETTRENCNNLQPFIRSESFTSPVRSAPSKSQRRFESEENWRSDKNKYSDWKESKSSSRGSWIPPNSKQMAPNDNWNSTDTTAGGSRGRSDRGNNKNSKFGGNRGRNDWENPDSKPGGNRNRGDKESTESKFGGNKGYDNWESTDNRGRGDWDSENLRIRIRAFKPDRNGDERKDYFGERKKFDENRRGRERSNVWNLGGEDSKSRNRNSSIGSNDSRKKFDSSSLSGKNKPKSLRRPIRRDDAAPLGSKFEDRVTPLGSCEKGIVTYYFSPDEFFVQLLSQEVEFKQMMKDIQAYYCDKYSIRDPLHVGDIVIAQFSVDKVLYRAEVIRTSPLTVRYVDYGNQEPVGLKETWLVDKKFLKLPKQVVKCRLPDIQPAGTHWPPPGGEVDRFFEGSAYECTFINLENDCFEISMKGVADGKDVASEIIAAGLGRPKPTDKLEVPKIDYFLLPKQVLRLYVSHVESSSKFFVIINPLNLEIIENELKLLNKNKEKNLKPLSEDLKKPGVFCLSTNDNVSWYRGIIIKTDGFKVLIWFLDRGDSVEVPSDKIMILPDHLKYFEPQSVECSLHRASDVNEEKFKQTIAQKNHLVYIESAAEKRLSVVLYDQEGQKFDFQASNNSPQTIEPIAHLPIISQKIPVIISHMESLKEIYVQRIADEEEISKISELLENFYSEEKDEFSIEKENPEGSLVAAKSVFYDCWYRGRLLSLADENAEVFYIDYGNREILPREKVKKLCFSFFYMHAMAKKLSFDVEFSSDKTADIINNVLKITQDKEVLGYFYSNNGELMTEFILNDERITHLLKSSGLVELKQTDIFTDVLSGKTVQLTEKPSIVYETQDVEANELLVCLSHIENPNQFWAHKESEANDLLQFQNKLQASCKTFPEKKNIKVGDIVAAMFSDMWYRARVTKVEDNNLTVQYIDYGNTLMVDLSCSTVKELRDEFLNAPVFATSYSLKGSWKENATSKFEEIILQHDEPVSVVVLEDSDPPVVDLIQKGRSITDILVKAGVGEKEKKEFEDKEESEEAKETVKESQLYNVYITHAYSPSDFYIHRESCLDTVKILSETLGDVSDFSTPSSIQENQIYAARYPNDGAWYRARVIKKNDNKIEAHFIDYGNTSIVTELKSLPSNVASVPELAERCCLLYGDNCDSWSEAACNKFDEYSNGQKLKMEIVAKRAKKLFIKLFFENKSLTEELEALCEKDGREEVYVSHALSPTDFYIQYVEDDKYKLIAEKLESGSESENLENKKPGILCQACFVDDGYWYRAKILRDLNNEFEVFFIDFGNISVSKDLKKLPPEIKDIPPRALRCALNLPETSITEAVKEEFMSLVAEAPIFQARIITPGDLNVVSLKFKGRILEEILNLNSGFPNSENCETDDGKNLKKIFIRENYLDSTLADELDEVAGQNETDEEKRSKIVVSELSASEGFKSDNQKTNEETMSSSVINATDYELLLEGSERVDSEDLEASEVIKMISQNEISFEHIIKDEKLEENILNNNSRQALNRNKAHKIVPGSISRGEKKVNELITETYPKVKFVDKVVPGSISRGVSLECVADKSEIAVKPRKNQLSQSAPGTPKLERKLYVKVDRSERLVPGCISTVIPLHCNPSVEKIPLTEKIVPGSVNGSTLNR